MISRDFEIYYYNDLTLSQVAVHEHDYYEFYMFLEGNVSMQMDKKMHLLKYGDLVVIPPHRKHRAVIHDQKKPYRRFVFWISKDFFAGLQELSEDYTYIMRYSREQDRFVFHVDDILFNSLQTKVLRLIEEMKTKRFAHMAYISVCVQDLILMMNRMVYEQNHPTGESEDHSLSQKVLFYIEEHLEEPLTLEQLARQFYVSKYHISHIFKDNFGLSVHQYIIKKRLEACREAMLGNVGIAEICQNYGFGEYSSFYRAFKKEFGISPRDFQMEQKRNLENHFLIRKEGDKKDVERTC